MGIFFYIYIDIRSKAQTREKRWKSEKLMLKRWLQQYISNYKHPETKQTCQKSLQDVRKHLSKFDWSTDLDSYKADNCLKQRAESEANSDSNWIHFSILIKTFATEVQIWWFKMIQKDDWKGYNSCQPDPWCTYHSISTAYKIDLTFLIVRLSQFQFQILFSNIFLDYFGKSPNSMLTDTGSQI